MSRSDEQLMQAYAGGEAAAFRELFERFSPSLLRLMRRQVRDPGDAEDLVQQTFLQLHRARLDYSPERAFRPWIVTIALNLRRDYLRRSIPRRVVEADLEQIADPGPEDQGDPETSARVRAALAELPADQRTVIELHWFQELSFGDIAQVVGATAGAVRVRAHRGYQRLRQTLGPDLPGNISPPSNVRKDRDGLR